MFLLLTGRYDNVIYSVAEETLPSRSDKKRYNAFTPDIALNYKIIPAITLFASIGMGYKTPTDKELESPQPAFLYNQDLRAQTSATLKAGIKGTLRNKEAALFFKSFHYPLWKKR